MKKVAVGTLGKEAVKEGRELLHTRLRGNRFKR